MKLNILILSVLFNILIANSTVYANYKNNNSNGFDTSINIENIYTGAYNQDANEIKRTDYITPLDLYWEQEIVSDDTLYFEDVY